MDIAESNRFSVIASRGTTCHRYKIYCRETADHELASDTPRYPIYVFSTDIFREKSVRAIFHFEKGKYTL